MRAMRLDKAQIARVTVRFPRRRVIGTKRLLGMRRR